MFDDLRVAGLTLRFEDDHCMHRFAPLRTGDADHRASSDSRVTGDGTFHFAGINVFPAADDHVLEAIDNVEIARIIHVGAIAGVHPAAAQGLGSFFRLVPVAEHNVRPAHHHFAHRTARYFIAQFVDNAHGYA
ncbi:hypothetical protein D3C78_1296680 [compost metagenome]